MTTTRKIAISNKKGGVGKTTIALLSAQELLRRGYKVLFIDCDSQRNSTKFYDAKWEDPQITMADILFNDSIMPIDCIQHCKYGDIIAADKQLEGADNKIKRGPKENVILRNKLKSIDGIYDFIVFDTNPSVDVILNNVLTASDYLVIPINGQYALDGIADFDETVSDIQETTNPELANLGFVFNMYKKHVGISRDSVEDAEEIAEIVGTSLFDTKIRQTSDCERALTDLHIPLHEFKKKGNTLIDATEFVSELLRKIKNTPNGKDLVIKRAKN